MKFSILAAAALLTGFVASQFGNLPTCADNCVISAIPSSCNLDPSCICRATNFIQKMPCCVGQACPQKTDQVAVISYANAICNPVGVTNLPTAATCAPSAANVTSSMPMTASAALSSSTSSVESGLSSSASTAAASTPKSSNVANANNLWMQGAAGVGAAFLGAMVLL